MTYAQPISRETSLRRWQSLGAVGCVLVFGLALRLLFFEGCFWANDDWYQVRYAYLWPGPPANIYDARLFFNMLLRAALHVFGYGPVAWAFPGLLGSLMLTGSSIALALRKVGIVGGVAAGLITASLPIDLAFSTVPLAQSLAVGFFGIAVFLLMGFESRIASVGAIGAAALAVLAHPSVVFHVIALAVAFFLFAVRRRAIVFGFASLVLYFALEFAISAVVTGNPFHNFAILREWHDPEAMVVLFSRRWFTKPFSDLFFSKSFGFAFPTIALALLMIPELRRSRLCKVLAFYCFGAWLWFSFGSAKPTIYEPFWRDTRFWHPMALSVGVLIGMIVSARPRLRTPLLAAFCALHILLMAGSGVWGQSKHISLEMLRFVQNNPDAGFLTDPLTRAQMLGWNGFHDLSNVCVLPCGRSWQHTQRVFVLYNPLNQPVRIPNRPPPASLGFDALRCAAPALTTEAKPRLLVAWLPSGIWSRYPLMIRRPVGYVRQLLASDSAGTPCHAKIDNSPG